MAASPRAPDETARRAYVCAWLCQHPVRSIQSEAVTAPALHAFVFGRPCPAVPAAHVLADLRRAMILYYVRGDYAALWPAFDSWRFPVGAWKAPGPCMYNVTHRRFVCTLTYDEMLHFALEVADAASGTRRSP